MKRGERSGDGLVALNRRVLAFIGDSSSSQPSRQRLQRRPSRTRWWRKWGKIDRDRAATVSFVRIRDTTAPDQPSSCSISATAGSMVAGSMVDTAT